MVRQRRATKQLEGYDVKSWIFLPQYGNDYSLVDADSSKTKFDSGDLGEN